ncbi:hypothetical protein ACOMHN_045323 [Nucella lapillus]
MATVKTPGGRCSRAISHSVFILLLLFLGQFARGQGPGGGDTRVDMTVTEESGEGVVVGALPVRTGYTYKLEEGSPLFELDNKTNTIRTKVKIDREALASDSISLFVGGTRQSEAFHPVDITISVKDINDNAPRFDENVASISFQEDARVGQQHLIVTANDPDKGKNGTIVEYKILSGNEDGKFDLTPPSNETPFLFMVSKYTLDRETKDSYQLNISAKDGGDSPLYGYLQLKITITDVNDNPPTFDHSEYVTHIKESASVGTSVIRVEASDNDIGENAQIDYFLSPESSGQFKIDKATGVIKTLTSPLECSRPSCGSPNVKSMVECDPNSCLLTVEARDRGSTPQDGRAYIYVSIIDENDHDPIITFEPVAQDPVTGAATTDENASGLRVATVSVTDMDRGMNGQTNVQIIMGNEADHFRLVTIPTPQNTVRYIQVKGSLDRETIPQYNLTLKAVDKGSPPRSSTAYLIITVNDANDHAPVFQKEEYYAKLSELAIPGSFVAGVKAVDEDSGPNSQLTYTILAGNDQGWFTIDDATGLVTTRVALDHEVADKVILNISAHDSGATPYKNYTKLIVDILDENDMAPQFRNALTRVELDENKAENQNIATLTANDFDSGNNGTVFYHLHPDTELLYPGVFRVGRTSGSVTTSISLDRETVPSYIIKVIAKDGGSPSLSSTATILLKVRDLNDNVPEFHPSSYYVNIFETDPAGVHVVQVSAIDRDVGSYGRVLYSFTGSAFNKFSIDPNTGVITTNTVLRRSSGSTYQLSVVAKDGSDHRSERAATVTITVASINDAAPTFTKSAKRFDITEDFGSRATSLGQTVGQVQATGGVGSGITYFITNGDPYEVFSIDSSGFIKRNKLVDREKKGQYVLTVIASSGSKFGEMTVTINVRDVNDNNPHFIATTSETTVMENWPVGNNIFLAAAEDSDAGVNALLVYSVRSDDDVNGVFEIDQNTGIISLQKPTAEIQKSHVTLNVTVRDSGTPQRTDSINIVVKIQDVNDHTPFFPRNVYSVYILESRPVNENIMKLVATDKDEGRNGELVYKIMRGNEEGRFGIFPDGTIFIAHTLDRETRDMYALMIQVRDCGDRPRSSSANVTIYVLDANDNSPVFANSSYIFSVPENRPGGTFVGNIKAHDHDVGQNAELVFSLTEGNANFTIDPISGVIYTRRPFDREYVMDTSSVEFYTVDVFATDGGSPKLRGKSTVKVIVSDVNDNPPVFARALFSATVPENAVRNAKVIKMTATDADISANGAVTYVITEGNVGNKFKISETTGEITVAGTLDRETKDHYMLTVVATDTGSGVQLSSSAQVSITVMDYNDNPPQFTSTETQLSVEETKSIGELLTVFSGKDLDQGNNAKMYFSIYSGNEDDVFNLDGYTGKLYLVRQLDYETRQEYLLNVSVTDEGYHPSLSSYMFFRIRVIDTNDNAPQFTDGFKSINVREDTINEQIATLHAEDKDSGKFGDVRYDIISQDPDENMFRIDRKSGMIFVDKKLDRETTDYYKLVITATDQAIPESLRRTTQKSLNIIIQDVNDNAPVFRSPPAFLVPASESRGQAVATVFADDADSGDNGRVTYSLLSMTSLFSVHSSTGLISLLQNMPSTPHMYTLRVMAIDNGGAGQNDKKSNETTIKLLLSSSEDGPVFQPRTYSKQLSEDDPPNTSVFRVSASVTRPGVSVEYYLTGITSGGKQRGEVFRVDSSTGVVTTTTKLDREVLGDEFTLSITAVEKGGTSPRNRTTQATVTLRDVNDTPPRFSPSVYNVSYPEYQDNDPSVVRVGWSDPDLSGQVQLRLQGDGSDKFDIQTDGTIVAIALPLDRETKDRYTLVVTADDSVHTASASVTIAISDYNDNKPVFTQQFYSFEVHEDADSGATVARVTALDADVGENARVTYDLLSTWGTDRFQLDSVLGTFTLIGGLDYEARQLYTLQVLARDGGSPPRSSVATVYMNVLDVNDNEPEFDPASYTQLIYENVPVGTTVLNITATDVDSGRNGEVRYSLVGDSNLLFTVDPVTGTIQTAGPLDRETQTTYTLNVRATDQAPDPDDRRFTTAVVTVSLRDVNDNSPQFSSANSTSVKEETPNGTVVFTISASDRDSGVNNHVTFTLAPVPGLGYPFVLDPRSGHLKVNTALRREAVANYSLMVTATDGGSPPLSATQMLLVNIEDVNNNPPVFTSKVYRKTVAENVTVGTSILRVLATDVDEDLNGIVRYFIVSGDASYDFALDMASGVLRLQKPLDYERLQDYRLVVRAEDSGVERTLSSHATVIVTVTDVNDFRPVFDDSPYIAYVQEGMSDVPVEVTTVRARDEDSDANNRVAYQLRDIGSEVKGVFQMDQMSGRITALTALDREATPMYTLTIIATDSGLPRLTGTGTLTVYVKDVNDHAPTFGNSAPYVGHVTENGGNSQSVITVTATDLDEGVNAQIIYHLKDSQGDSFTVLPSSGEIIATRPLDREQQSQYHLVVIATDQGIPPRSSSCSVNVYVDDVNDNTPAFEQASYAQTIVDPTNSGDFVVGVTAVDRDTGNNGKVVYSLVEADSRFLINSETGVVIAAQRLNGSGSSYTFRVRASDLGQTPLTTTVSVTVTLQRVTGAPPVFADFPSNVRISENSLVGTVLATVSATTSRSNSLSYYIVGGNVNSALTINKDNGTITVAGLIDYEVASSLSLWLQAKDKASLPLAVYRELKVTVDDLNDNLPRFNASFYHTTFLENQPLGTTVMQVQASDADDGANKQIEFRLASGNENNTFGIHPTSGRITTRNPVVDREGIPMYMLVVEAVDQGSPKLTATATVKIVIIDRNDNPPVFSVLFSVAVPEDLPLHSLILTLTSTDRDTLANANATYQLIPGPDSLPFAVDPISGNITNIKILDAETKERYRPDVRVSDSSYAAETQVTIRLLDVNDNPPRFARPDFMFELREGQRAGTVVGRLLASDRDISSPNNQFYFSLKRPSTLFELNAESGEIKALRNLEYQRTLDGPSAMNVHTLEVMVTDLGMPSLSSQATVTISVTDANNHAPVFEHSDYVSAVPENAGSGTSILTVEANDYLDYGLNAEVTYSIQGGNGSYYFAVDKDKGVVSVKRALTNQRGRNFVVVLRATDKGDPAQSSSANVVLSITDVNTYPPEFRNNIFQKSVKENVAVGYIIDTLSANDRDSGLNGRVRFSIPHGNEEGLFAIHPVSGSFTVAKKLDYETKRSHALNIVAKDMGLLSRSVSRIYNVSLLDVNDNSPVFNQSVYNTFVAENSARGTIILNVRAHDADSGNNAVVRYSITGNSLAQSKFAMDEVMGSMTVEGSLDYESRDLYTLTIMAYNPSSGGSPVMKNVAEVRVYVTGVNEFYPQFAQKVYNISVSESAAMNTTLTTIRATDRDKGVDGVVYYYLVGSSNLKGFTVEPLTGALVVVSRPDYESSPRILLTAMAKNWGSIQGNDTDTCTIHITVQDANDPPVFQQEDYFATIKEESLRNTHVVTVKATDNDIRSENRFFQYHIKEGDEGSKFNIDTRSGRIFTTGNGVLDREAVPQYRLVVVAEDSGDPPQTGTCTVLIHLQDINDNGPVFVPRQLTAYVMEGQPPGTHVITLSMNTSDPDLSPHQGPYTYEAVPGSSQKFFQIFNQTGRVQTRTRINREENPIFRIPVVVYDNGIGADKMSSTLTFTVVVNDVNNSPPQARPLTVRVTVLQGMSAVGVIADVRPLDADLQGNYTCRIHSGAVSVFSITNGCELRVLVEPEQESYVMVVAGSDGSFQEVSYNVTVQLQRFTQTLIGNAVAVILDGITSSDFLETKYVAFISAVESLFGRSSRPFVFSLGQASGGDLYVYLAVEENDVAVDQKLLAQKLREFESTLESRAGVKVKEAAVQLCASNPCQNGGSCATGVALSPGLVSSQAPHLILTSATPSVIETCLCPPAYGGNRCQTAQQPCGDSFCANGGTCQGNVCRCPSAWTGRYCQDDVNECLTSPCQSGGSCTNSPGSFTCQCTSEFYGPVCEHEYQCVSGPCRNGATCQDEPNGYQCQCLFGYYGDQCQESSLGFQEGSFLTLQPISKYTKLVISGFLATASSHGLLLFNSVTISSVFSGYMALEVVEGAVRFSFNLAGESARPIRVEVNGTRVNTGHWYRVEANLQIRLASLVVQRCEDDGRNCRPCDRQNRACYRTVTFPDQNPAIQGGRLSVGGVEDFSPILRLSGQIRSHDFVGCMHSLQANGRSLLNRSGALNVSKVADQCPRRSANSPCAADSCGGGGECVDRWSHVQCRCGEGYSGPRCESKWQPFGFGPNARVTFLAKESYRRDQLLLQTGSSRRRRAVSESSLLLRVRPSEESGILFVGRTAASACYLWMEEGAIKFVLAPSTAAGGAGIEPIIVAAELLDGAWHNVTLTTGATNVTVSVDGRKTRTQTRVMGPLVFPLDSLDILSLQLGGNAQLPGGRTLKGFNGCVSEFRIKGNKLPLNGTSDRYSITATGDVSGGCAAVCSSNPCADSQGCVPDGEGYNCSAVAVAAEEGLKPGIIVVIVFFIIILVAIVIVFVLFRVRRGWFHKCLPVKGEGETSRKSTSGSKLMGTDNHLHHLPPASRYAENAQLEEMIIRNHIAEELGGQKTSSLTARPDLIGSNMSGVPQPTHFADGTMIIENIDQNDVGNVMMGLGGDDMPEHYDLENASSIAPSDSDIIQHYQRFRHGNDLKAHLNHHSHHHPARDRFNPANGLQFKENAHTRQSPVSVTGSALSMPARNSPLVVPGQSGRPSSALAALHHGGPFPARDSPRSPPGALNTSHSQGSNSAHSLGSHHSHSSSSSNPHPQPNGHGPHRTPKSGKGPGGGRYPRGLTVDEVNRLNARADLKNTASMLEAVSSSSEDPHHHRSHHHHHPTTLYPPIPHPHRLRPDDTMEGNILLEPPDSSSSDSGANDSFTCSEFEYENDRNTRLDPPSARVLSQLPEVDEDNLPGVSTRFGDGLNSNGDSGGSTNASNEGPVGSSPLTLTGGGALNLDSFLNLGPSFDKLVGVFKDIALLPDSSHNLEGATSNDYEEYV